MKRLSTFVLILFIPFTAFSQSGDNLTITHITVIDMTGAPPRADVTVTIANGKIVRIGKTPLPGRRHGTVVDGSGKFLIPAFWDMHVHIGDPDVDLPLYVANGVLGVRDMGGPSLDKILELRSNQAAGRIVGPRIVTAGKILDGSPPTVAKNSVVVRTPDEGRKAVLDLKTAGVDFLKVYDLLSRESYYAIIDEAKRNGLFVAGHVPWSVSTIEASDAGQHSIEHLGKALEDASSDPAKIKARREKPIKDGDYFAFTTRFGSVLDATVETVDAGKLSAIFEHFRRNRTFQVPTLAVKYSRTFIDDLDAKDDVRMKYVTPAVRESWRPATGFFSRYRTPTYIAAQKRYFQKELELFAAMDRSGVPIMAGTDHTAPFVIAGFGLHDELALYVKAGMTPLRALQSATRAAAEYLGELGISGTVEKGKLADLLILDADPLKNISNTTRINAVIQRGRYLSRSDLDKMLAGVEALAKRK